MRIFTRKGNLKPKKSNEEEVCKSLLENGWVEVDKTLTPIIGKPKSKAKPKEEE